MSYLTKSLKLLCTGCAVLAAAIGLLVMIGWHLHSIEMIKLFPFEDAMKYNTAVSLIILGIASVLLCRNYQKSAAVLAVVVLANALLVLVEQLFQVSMRIDELFMKDWYEQANHSPGRMAPNTAICFILVSLAYISNCFMKQHKSRLIALSLLGLAVFSLSSLFATAYMLHVKSAYAWGQFTPMSFNAAIGFVLLGITLMSYAARRAVEEKIDILATLPIGIIIAFGSALLILWLALSYEENRLGIDSFLPALVLIIGCFIIGFFTLATFFLNIALRKNIAIKKSLSIINATFESANNGILVLDNSGKVSQYNKKYLTICGLPSNTHLKNCHNGMGFFIPKIKLADKFLAKLKTISDNS